MKRKKPAGPLMVGAMFVVAFIFLATGMERENGTLLLCSGLMVVCAILTMMQRRYKG